LPKCRSGCGHTSSCCGIEDTKGGTVKGSNDDDDDDHNRDDDDDGSEDQDPKNNEPEDDPRECNPDLDDSVGFCDNGNFPLYNPYTRQIECDVSLQEVQDNPSLLSSCQAEAMQDP
jgi:hypothetical protein